MQATRKIPVWIRAADCIATTISLRHTSVSIFGCSWTLHYLMEAGVGDLREVVVLIVVAHVVGQHIEGPVVAIGLLTLRIARQYITPSDTPAPALLCQQWPQPLEFAEEYNLR
jgi:hypothetical protein